MRRDARRRAENSKIWEDNSVIISGVIIVGIIALILGIIVYVNITKNNDIEREFISLESEKEMDNINTESASSSIGNTVKQSEDANNTNQVTQSKETSTTNTNVVSNQKEASNNTTTNTKTDAIKETKPTNSNTESDTKISFSWPVKGDVLKAFSMDNLLFSSTLQEWTTHNGIDIKANKAAAVSAAADGTVKSIKNDPRFGLSVTIEHANGYKTVYSNLLTAEFVVEGEKVKQGQNIGTVGNTANFEVADDFHLHFEILKDSEYVDPMIYLK